MRVDTTFPSSISLEFLPDIVSFLFSSPTSLLSTDNFSLLLPNSTSLSFPPLFTEFLPSLFSLRSEIFSLVLESSVRLLSVFKFSLTSDNTLFSLVLVSLSLSVPRLTSFLIPDRDSFLLLRSVLLLAFIVSFLSPSSVLIWPGFRNSTWSSNLESVLAFNSIELDSSSFTSLEFFMLSILFPRPNSSRLKVFNFSLPSSRDTSFFFTFPDSRWVPRESTSLFALNLSTLLSRFLLFSSWRPKIALVCSKSKSLVSLANPSFLSANLIIFSTGSFNS